MPACCTPSLCSPRLVAFTTKRVSRIRRRAHRRGPGREGPGKKVTENSLHTMPWPHGAELYEPKEIGLGGTNTWTGQIAFQHMPASMPPSPLSPQGSSHNHAMANGPDRRQHTFPPPPPPRPVPSLEASGTNDQRATLQQKQQQRYPEGRTWTPSCRSISSRLGRALGRPMTSTQSRRIPQCTDVSCGCMALVMMTNASCTSTCPAPVTRCEVA